MNKENKIVVIGITGSIGSGKSTLSNIISKNGYKVISSDDNAKTLMNNDSNLKSNLIKEFGINFYNSDGTVNSSLVSEIVFGDSSESNSKLEKLNRLVHPLVIEKMVDEIETLMNNDVKVVFVESALMFETGLFEGFDYVVTVNTNKDILINRVMQRSNLSKEQVESRLKSQMSSEEKKKYADFVIENSGSIESLEQSVNFLLPILTNLPPKEFDEEENED